MSVEFNMCPDSQRCVRQAQIMSGQLKMHPDSSRYIRTVQNMVGRERWLRTFLVCRERDLRVFCPEDFCVPPGRYTVFRLLLQCKNINYVHQKWKNIGLLTKNTFQSRTKYETQRKKIKFRLHYPQTHFYTSGRKYEYLFCQSQKVLIAQV